MLFLDKIRKAIGGTTGGIDPQLSNDVTIDFPMWSKYGLKNVSKTDYLSKYYTGWSFVAVSTISNHFASLDYTLTNGSGKPVDDYRLKLLNYNFFLNISAYLKLNGNCYVWKNKVGNKLLDLVILRPDLVQTKLNDAKTRVSHYMYANKRFEKEDIIHFVQFNPLYPFPATIDGVGDVQAVAMTIDGDRKASERNRRFFDQSAIAKGVLQTDKQLSQEGSERIQEKRDEKYKGLSNSHKIAVLTGGLKYVPMSPSAKEMDFVESRKLNRDEILGIYKVPKAILGLGEGGQTLNIGKFERIFAKEVINPLAKQVQELITKELFGDQYTFQFINVVPFDQQEMRNNYVVEGITLNEFRKTIGFPEVDGGDKFRSEMLTQGMPVVDTEKTAIQEATQGIVGNDFKNLLGNLVKKGLKAEMDKTSEEYMEKQREKKIARNNKYEDAYSEKLNTIFNRQEKDLMKQYADWYKKNKDKIENQKSIKAIYPVLSTVKRSIVYYELLKATQSSLVQAEGTQALLQVGIGEPANVTDPATISLLKKNINKRSFEVDTFTNKKITKNFTTILNQGLSVEDGSKLLGKTFTELKTSRLESIVRTETIRAGNAGSQLGYEQSGVVSEKQWYTALDERVCPFCGPEHGKTVELEKTFYKKGDTAKGVDENGKTVTMKMDYGDVEFPPLHPNCRCSIVPVVE